MTGKEKWDLLFKLMDWGFTAMWVALIVGALLLLAFYGDFK